MKKVIAFSILFLASLATLPLPSGAISVSTQVGYTLPEGWKSYATDNPHAYYLVGPDEVSLSGDPIFPIDLLRGPEAQIVSAGPNDNRWNVNSLPIVHIVRKVDHPSGHWNWMGVDWCSDWSSTKCNSAARNESKQSVDGEDYIQGTVGLNSCRNEQETLCIESVSVNTASEIRVASLVDNLGTEIISQDPQLPSSVRGLLFQNPLSPQEEIVVSAKSSISFVDGEMEIGLPVIAIATSKSVLGNYSPPGSISLRERDGLVYPQWEQAALDLGGPRNCIWILPGKCGVETDTLKDLEVTVTFRVPNDTNGWFAGRISNASFEVEKGPYFQTVSIQAQPAEVPVVFIYCDMQIKCSEFGLQNGGGYVSSVENFSTAPPGSIDAYLKPLVGLDGGVSSRKRLLWEVGGGRTYGPEISTLVRRSEVDKCLNEGGISGLMASDATWMQKTIPTLQSGVVTYRISGFHYDHMLQVQQGNYLFQISKNYLSCLYKTSGISPQVSVQVVNVEDSQDVAVELFGTRGDYYFASGSSLTFSEKEVQFRIVQPFSKTLAKFSGPSRALSSNQKSEIRASVTKAKGNPKFICTGPYVNASSKATALARARAVCNYAKSLDKNHSYYAQAKQTKAKSYDKKVMITSK